MTAYLLVAAVAVALANVSGDGQRDTVQSVVFVEGQRRERHRRRRTEPEKAHTRACRHIGVITGPPRGIASSPMASKPNRS